MTPSGYPTLQPQTQSDGYRLIELLRNLQNDKPIYEGRAGEYLLLRYLTEGSGSPQIQRQNVDEVMMILSLALTECCRKMQEGKVRCHPFTFELINSHLTSCVVFRYYYLFHSLSVFSSASLHFNHI